MMETLRYWSIAAFWSAVFGFAVWCLTNITCKEAVGIGAVMFMLFAVVHVLES